MNYSGSAIQRKMAAWQLTYDIRKFNRLAKTADKPSRRSKFYRLKHEKLSHGLTRYAEYFKLASVEFNCFGNLLVLIQLADGKSGVHCPWDELTAEAQARVRSVLVASLTTNPTPQLPLAA